MLKSRKNEEPVCLFLRYKLLKICFFTSFFFVQIPVTTSAWYFYNKTGSVQAINEIDILYCKVVCTSTDNLEVFIFAFLRKRSLFQISQIYLAIYDNNSKTKHFKDRGSQMNVLNTLCQVHT